MTRDNKEIMSGEQVKQMFESREGKVIPFLEHNLNIDKYDINFVINVLKTILRECDRHKINPKDLHISLSQSVKRLLAMLEVERDHLNLSK